ncbi:MAG TPA: hypothetical protein VGO59_02320 [Verrucomicrobiae bacterium]|jgi:hypothetical protein
MPLKTMMGKLIPRRSAWFVWAALLSLAALAARADLRFDAFLGYDNILPERSWFPVTCEIYNDGPAFNATVEVSAAQFGAGQSRRFKLDLPTNTRKRITIPVFTTAVDWTARLLDESGKVRGEQALQPTRVMKNNLPLVAALARTVGGAPALPEVLSSQNGDTKYPVARLQTSLFPENPLALDGINMLYLSSEKAVELSVGQVNALMAWLQDGGHLVVGIEQLTDVNGTAWLRDLLPCTVSSIGNANSHEALQEWARGAASYSDAAAQAKPRRQKPGAALDLADSGADDVQFDAAPMSIATGQMRDGKVLIGDGGAPFAIEGIRGRGTITVLMFNAEREPFISWKNRTWFWSKLAGVAPGVFLNQNATVLANRLSSDGIFRAIIETKQVRKLPLGWLLALLVAYLVVIGPLDQYCLKKLNRQMLTWITFPCYVVFFSALIYFIGFHLRAGELEWNELNVVDVLPSEDHAVLRGQTYVSIYSPNNAHYQLAGSEKFASLRGEYMGNFGGNQEHGGATVNQLGNNFQADAFVQVWTSEMFVSDWIEKAAQPLGMAVEHNSGGWDVTVTNSLDHDLPGLRVVLGGSIYTLGDVPAGQTKTFPVSDRGGTAIGEMARQYSQSFREAVQALNQSFGNNANYIPNPRAATEAASFLSYINNQDQQAWNNFTGPSSLDISRFTTGPFAILLAWDGNHSPAKLNQFTPKRYHSDTLFRLVVPVKT